MFQRIQSSGSLSAEVVSNIKEYGRPLAALFSLRPHSFLLRKKGIAAASEEASSIPFPPGRRKLHIRSLLLPFQIVTVSLGHNLAIWNFTTPHAILMMAGRQHFTDTACRGRCPHRPLQALLKPPVRPCKYTENAARIAGRVCIFDSISKRFADQEDLGSANAAHRPRLDHETLTDPLGAMAVVTAHRLGQRTRRFPCKAPGI